MSLKSKKGSEIANHPGLVIKDNGIERNQYIVVKGGRVAKYLPSSRTLSDGGTFKIDPDQSYTIIFDRRLDLLLEKLKDILLDIYLDDGSDQAFLNSLVDERDRLKKEILLLKENPLV